MATQLGEETTTLEAALPGERARLVRLCARLTGDPDAAEDLAQETLYEAWRHEHRLRDPEKRAAWLTGIARNVCLRWGRSRGRELARRALPVADGGGAPAADPGEGLADDFDLEVELERRELVELLDRALALLPPATRAALIARYVEGSPHAEIAARLGVSPGAVKVRLQRGRLALRRVLTAELHREAAPYGLGAADAGRWRETRIWCPYCGERRLVGRFSKHERDGMLHLKCPHCCAIHDWDPNVARAPFADIPELPAVLGGVQGYKPALSRVMRWTHAYYERGLRERVAPCMKCGRPTPVRTRPPEDWPPAMRERRSVHVRCRSCGITPNESLAGLVLILPAGRDFWRRHPRMRHLPEREVEAGGRAAVVTTFESVTGLARLAVVSARDTYEVISIHPPPGV